VTAIRPRRVLVVLIFPLALAACSSGSTDVTTGPTGASATGPTGPTGASSTGATGEVPTGATGTIDTSIAGTWQGTWTTDLADFSGTFSMTFEVTTGGFAGTIQIQDANCVSDGKVTASVDGTTITIGAVQAEQRIEFEGEVNGDTMSGTYASPAGCGNDRGTWEATLAP